MATFLCHCGCARFSSTVPHPDEEQLAVKLYEQEIEESKAWSNLS